MIGLRVLVSAFLTVSQNPGRVRRCYAIRAWPACKRRDYCAQTPGLESPQVRQLGRAAPHNPIATPVPAMHFSILASARFRDCPPPAAIPSFPHVPLRGARQSQLVVNWLPGRLWRDPVAVARYFGGAVEDCAVSACAVEWRSAVLRAGRAATPVRATRWARKVLSGQLRVSHNTVHKTSRPQVRGAGRVKTGCATAAGYLRLHRSPLVGYRSARQSASGGRHRNVC
jgi:hypothetical protein